MLGIIFTFFKKRSFMNIRILIGIGSLLICTPLLLAETSLTRRPQKPKQTVAQNAQSRPSSSVPATHAQKPTDSTSSPAIDPVTNLPIPSQTTPENNDLTESEEKQTAQVAVANVLTIAANVANIVHNPHNHQAVIHNAQGILNSILNIVAAAAKRSGTNLDQATYIALLSSIDKELHTLVKNKKRSLAIQSDK
jgi:hypothetical protein